MLSVALAIGVENMKTNIYGAATDMLTDRQMDMSKFKVSLERASLHKKLCKSVLFIEYYLGDQIKKSETGRACGTYRRGAFTV
jgi:hypothetical protein